MVVLKWQYYIINTTVDNPVHPFVCVCVCVATAPLGPRPLRFWGFYITHNYETHRHTRWDSSEREITWSQRPLHTQRTTNTRHEHPCRQGNSSPQVHQSSGHRPTPHTVRPPVSANLITYFYKLAGFSPRTSVKTEYNPCGMCGGQIETGTVFLRKIVVFTCQLSFPQCLMLIYLHDVVEYVHWRPQYRESSISLKKERG